MVAVDSSEYAKKAVDMACSLAELDSQIHIDLVNVVAIPMLDKTQMASFKEILDIMIDSGKKLLQNVASDMGKVQDQTDALLLTGTNPASEIIKLINEREYDLVVIGSRGLSGVQEYLGSVSHKVLHGSPTSVLVVK